MKVVTKLTVLFSAIILLLASSLTYFVYTTETVLLESAIQDRLQNQAFHTLDKIDMMLFERYADIKTLAEDPVIRAGNSTPEQITERLKSYRDNYKYLSLSFFDLNRVRLADTSGKDIGKQHPLTKYWQGLAAGRDFVVDISLSESTKERLIYFAVKVKDRKGTPFGVVVSRLPIERLDNIVQRIVGLYIIGQDIRMDLLDNNGLILYSDYNKEGILKEISPDWEDIKKALLEKKKVGTGRHIHPLIGDEIHAFAIEQGHLDFKGNEWALVLHIPAKIVFGPAVKTKDRIITLVVILYLFAILCIYLFSRRITRPIDKLMAASLELSKGNFNIGIDVTAKDEIGQLSTAFNEMARHLKEQQELLTGYAHELETRVATRTSELKALNEMLTYELAERRKTEDALLATKADLEMHNYEGHLLGEMTDLLQTSNDFESACSIITQTALQLFPENPGVFLAFNAATNLFEASAVWGKHPLSEQQISIEECWALRCGRIHVVDKEHADLQCALTKAAGGTHICVPIAEEEGKALGVLHLFLEAYDPEQDNSHALEEKKEMLTNMAGRLGISLSNLKLREMLRDLSIRDPLTGLFNRRYMEETLELEVLRAERKGTSLGIIMLDIDHFKKFNDTLGHAAGDALLSELGKFLQKHIRKGDIACRYGGEEFIVVLPYAQLEIARQRAKLICAEVKHMQIQFSGRPIDGITLSLGVAVFPEHGSTVTAVLQAADAALYKAKTEGRDRVCAAEEAQ